MMTIKKVLVDESGNNLLGKYYDDIILHKKVVIVRNESKFGAYSQGNFRCILNCEWDCIVEEEFGLKVKKDGKQGFYSFESRGFLGGYGWDKISTRLHGIIASKNNLQGFYLYTGEKVFDCRYRKVESYSSGVVAFANGKKVDYMI